jgi:hypothetical protein
MFLRNVVTTYKSIRRYKPEDEHREITEVKKVVIQNLRKKGNKKKTRRKELKREKRRGKKEEKAETDIIKEK